jgi:hypothetical protein
MASPCKEHFCFSPRLTWRGTSVVHLRGTQLPRTLDPKNPICSKEEGRYLYAKTNHANNGMPKIQAALSWKKRNHSCWEQRYQSGKTQARHLCIFGSTVETLMLSCVERAYFMGPHFWRSKTHSVFLSTLPGGCPTNWSSWVQGRNAFGLRTIQGGDQVLNDPSIKLGRLKGQSRCVQLSDAAPLRLSRMP